MSRVGRVAVALLVILVLAALWRTAVRAGDRNARPPGGIPAPGGLGEPVEAARHLEMRLGEIRRRLSERSTDPRLHLRLANLHYQRAYSRALEAFAAHPAAAKALEEGDDRKYREWMRKALARDVGGDLGESTRAARSGLAHAHEPERRWELLRSLARTECARGAHDREVAALEEGKRLRPRDPEVLSRLTRAYGEVGDLLALEESMEQAWRIQRGRGPWPPAASRPAPKAAAFARPIDRPWASSAQDGDEWLSGVY